MIRALIVAVLLSGWFAVLLSNQQVVFLTVISVAALGSAFEFCRMAFEGFGLVRRATVLLVMVAAGVVSIWSTGAGSVVTGMLCVCLWTVGVLSLPSGVDEAGLSESMRYLGLCSFGLWLMYCWAGVARLYEGVNGTYIVTLASACIWFRDLAANIGGRLLRTGKPIAPQINQSKTWGGAVFALVATVTFGMVWHWAWPGPIDGRAAMVIACASGVGGQSGDLLESLLKRASKVRDSSRIFSSHQGGVLDGIDGFLVAVPLTEAGLRWLSSLTGRP